MHFFRRLSSPLHLATSIICLACIILPGFAVAKMHFSPVLLLDQEYTDNYFRSEIDQAEFWVTQISPGFGWEFFTDRSRVNLDYAFSYFWNNSPDGNIDASKQDYPGHDLNFYAGYRGSSRLTLALSDVFYLTREPALTDEFSNIVDRNKYWRNRVEPFITYDIGEKGEAKLGYRNDQLQWLEQRPEQENSSENRGILTLTYHLNDTNHLDLDGQFWNRDYDGIQSDYNSYQAVLIYRREFTSSWKGEVGAGYQGRDFEDPNFKDLDEPVFYLGLKGDTGVSKLEFLLQHNLVDYTLGDEYFTALRGDLYAEHMFLEKIRAYLGGYYQFSDFTTGPREDNTFNGRVGLGYLFLHKMFELGLEYSYNQRDSNDAASDYTENRVFLSLKLVYDFASK
ncbi:MAG: outer membrane beta-barrel protein [Deltaproteobacteria bacterium]|nr:MAG: outer membrane beta-barrel protein [Deltaproteobacteria bacterium]